MKLNFCPECASPLQNESDTKYACVNHHDFWNNPRGAVAVFFIKNNEVLFARRAHQPFKGKLDTPGGFLEYNEQPVDGAMREILEETGIKLKPSSLELIGAVTHQYIENITSSVFLFVCAHWAGEFKPADDVASFEWKPFGYLNSEDYAWDYHDAAKKLEEFIKAHV